MNSAPPVVWVVAACETAERWVARLREAGFAVGALPWASAKSLPFDPASLEGHDLVLFTSRRAALALPDGSGAGRAAACVGAATAEAARARGFDVVLTGHAGGDDVAKRILARRPKHKRVLFLCGRDARPEAPGALAHGGIDVDEVPVYAMEPVPAFADRTAAAADPTVVVVGSPRAAEALHAALDQGGRTLPEDANFVALGAVTAERAGALFGRYVARASSTDADGLAEAVRTALAGGPPGEADG